MRQYTVIQYRYVALMGVGWLPREQVHHYTAVPLIWRAKRFINAHAPNRTKWVLWGRREQYADGVVIKLACGSLRECHTEQRNREREGGWTLAVYGARVSPDGLRSRYAVS